MKTSFFVAGSHAHFARLIKVAGCNFEGGGGGGGGGQRVDGFFAREETTL